MLLFSLSSSLLAKSVKINEKGGIYEIQVPDSSDYHETMFNVNHVVFAPIIDGIGNTTISFTFMGISNAQLKPEDLKSTQGDYHEGKKRFMQEHSLKFVEFRPYEFKTSKTNKGVHTVAVIYIDADKSVTLDRTYLIECPKTLIFAKLLGDLGPEKNLDEIRKAAFADKRSKDLENIALNLSCAP